MTQILEPLKKRDGRRNIPLVVAASVGSCAFRGLCAMGTRKDFRTI